MNFCTAGCGNPPVLPAPDGVVFAGEFLCPHQNVVPRPPCSLALAVPMSPC